MKKTIVILSTILLSGIGFTGCQKKGANDPSISLHGRKARLTGEWTLSAGTSTDVSGGSTSTTTMTSTSATMTSGTVTTVYTYSDKLSFEKDGTWKEVTTASASGFMDTYTTSGTWNWTGGVGDLKKREQIVLKTLSSSDVQTLGTATTTTADTYTGDDAPSMVYEIDELKNKELIVIWDGTTSSSPGGVSSSKGSMTYIQ